MQPLYLVLSMTLAVPAAVVLVALMACVRPDSAHAIAIVIKAFAPIVDAIAIALTAPSVLIERLRARRAVRRQRRS